ncbi:2OG-Fe(II) oxygenase, partial [Pelagibacteraceae bacterium]|nr:2OG-Fe(II) oxygenase [Pelagibacteraceae bacterium]
SGDTKVIEPHLDNPVEFYAALLYMKDEDDNSDGGNLTTYDFKNKPSFYGKSRVREENVNLIEEIEYKKNRLVMFLNSPYSIHGVTKRSKTNFYRKYINIIGEFNFELFNYRNFLEK